MSVKGNLVVVLVSFKILNPQKNYLAEYKDQQEMNLVLHFVLRKFLSSLFRNYHFTKDCIAEYQNKKDIWCYTYNSRLEI